MKVIVLNDHLYPDGGADVVALSAAEGCAAIGLDVTLFVGDTIRTDDHTPRRARVVSAGQHDLLRNPNRVQAAVQGFWNPQSARLLREVLSQHRPQDTIVHLHSWTKSLSASVVRATLDAGFSLVLTLHEYFTVCPNGMLFNYQSGQKCGQRPMSLGCLSTSCDARKGLHKIYRVVRHGFQTQWGQLPRGIEHAVVVSRYSEQLLRPWLPQGMQFHHIRNPIEVPMLPAAPVAHNQGFVQVGRLFLPKNQSQFLQACSMAGVQGTCVGDGPDLPELQAQFPSAHFTGPLNRPDVIAQISQSRALVMPSLWDETQGLVCAEAAALGVPSVIYDRCAAVDFVQHERNGLVVPSGNVTQLAQALRRLADEPELAQRLGTQARTDFWRDAPTPERHAQELAALYERILQQRSMARSPDTMPLPHATRSIDP